MTVPKPSEPVAQRRGWFNSDIALMSVLVSLSYVSSSCYFPEYTQRSTCRSLTSDELCFDFDSLIAIVAGCHQVVIRGSMSPLRDLSRIWCIIDGSLVGFAFVGLP